MKILLTGAEGYIGSVLLNELQIEGFEVHGLDTGFFKEPWLGSLPRIAHKTIAKDTRNISPEDLLSFDAVVHLAELSNDPLGELDPDLTFRVNHLGSIRLARLVKEAGIKRFIYFSSCSVYGASSESASDETSPTSPLTAYAIAKTRVEKDLLAMASSGFSPIILRNATVYGVSPRMRFDLAVNNLAGIAWTQGKIILESDGTPWRPFVHIRDVCKAVILSLRSPDLESVIMNVGDDHSNHQIREIADIVARKLPHCELRVGNKTGDRRDYRVNFEKIKKALPEFKCEWNVSRGCDELLEFYRDIKLTRSEFESPPFTRLKQIKKLISERKINSDLYWIQNDIRS
jgi:nucleoside-diphosphate-sugar epimerase